MELNDLEKLDKRKKVQMLATPYAVFSMFSFILLTKVLSFSISTKNLRSVHHSLRITDLEKTYLFNL